MSEYKRSVLPPGYTSENLQNRLLNTNEYNKRVNIMNRKFLEELRNRNPRLSNLAILSKAIGIKSTHPAIITRSRQTPMNYDEVDEIISGIPNRNISDPSRRKRR